MRFSEILDGQPQCLTLEEIHRFEHVGLSTPTGPVWNLTDIWRNILVGLSDAVRYCESKQLRLESIGVDCWGVDWAMLGPSGELVALPHCYRDPLNDTVVDSTLNRIGGFESLYDRTGIQLMPINTIFQLVARFQKEPGLFQAAEHLVFVPDLFHYWLSGQISVERTIASTSSLLNVRTGGMGFGFDWQNWLADKAVWYDCGSDDGAWFVKTGTCRESKCSSGFEGGLPCQP